MKMIKIGDVAKRLGIDQKTIRFYERKALIKPDRSYSNYRLYSQDDVNTLHFILSARAYRLSIKEIRMLLRVKDRQGDICADVVDLFKGKVDVISEEIARLKKIRSKIQKCIGTKSRPNCCKKKICDFIQGGALWKKQS